MLHGPRFKLWDMGVTPTVATTHPTLTANQPESLSLNTTSTVASTLSLTPLGEVNMDEWNHTWFLPTLNLIYCVRSAEGRCVKPACSKSVWHENLTCVQYQVLPITERMPEDMVFATLAEQERRCPKCPIMVELKFGCK
ncbi:hypothetical protein B0H14DRAFT_2582594 [Mycena olivaceomarginata]|nr:hypothetical protein B0H14DRAFT_2582594 [Mycena olivaceomarginata]